MSRRITADWMFLLHHENQDFRKSRRLLALCTLLAASNHNNELGAAVSDWSAKLCDTKCFTYCARTFLLRSSPLDAGTEEVL